MIDISKLNDKRLLAYFKAERKRLFQHYRQDVIGEDQNGEPILGFTNDNNDSRFTEDIERFNNIKNELITRGNIK